MEPKGEGKEQIKFRHDAWWKPYTGREYDRENGQPSGIEIPPTDFELWETPGELMTQADRLASYKAATFRENFALVHSIFDSIP